MQPQNSPPSPTQSTSKTQAITFRDFAELARRRGWTVDDLAGRFNGCIERPTEFFTRVLSGKFKDSVIPFRGVLEFYQAAVAGPRSSARPTCACGCGRVVFDRKRYALPGCKKKTAREKVRDLQNHDGQMLDFVDDRRRQNRRVGPLLLTEHRRALRAV